MNYIDIDTTISTLQEYAYAKGWIHSEEQITGIEKPGNGNMNVVLRIKTNTRSFILKQSRPFVQKYQQIEAPLDRISVEHQFYKTVQNKNISSNLPTILAYDSNEHVLLLEDLGHCEDMTICYTNRTIEAVDLQRLTTILSEIHQNEVPIDFPENMEMRQLNHQHIFILPFTDNGFQLDDIQEGLQELSIPFKTDLALKAVVDEIGKKYLSPGNTLLHGDYYPGSWMTAADNLYVIDPEFGFAGFAEFDLGVMAAHIIMATATEKYLDTIHESYEGATDKKLMTQVAGIEIIRRLIGLAQLPLERTIAEKQYLLALARKMVIA